MSDNEYWADPTSMRATLGQMSEFVEQGRSLVDSFRKDREKYRGWNGYSDDFFNDTEPNSKKTDDGIEETFEGLSSAVSGLMSACFKSLDSIEGTQVDVSELIDHQKALGDLNDEDYDSGYESDDGHSGGRH
ncbi:hypothetical protein NKH77_28620 [Streptomyces sp. M19]